MIQILLYSAVMKVFFSISGFPLFFTLFLLLQSSLWSIDIPECKFTYEIKTFVFLAIYYFCPSFLVSIILCWYLTSFLWLITGAASPTPLEEMGLVHRKSDVDMTNSSDGSRPGSADSGSRKGILRPSSRSSTPEQKRIRSRSNSGRYLYLNCVTEFQICWSCRKLKLLTVLH